MNIIYESIVGSRLKGNATEESDVDTIGIFIAKNTEIGGFDWNDSKNVETDASPEGDDHTYYEIRKFFRLAAKSTPAILPFLGSHEVIESTDIGIGALRIAKGSLVSEEWLRRNGNYVRGKWHSYASTGKIKELIESYYIGELTCRWLVDGNLTNARLYHHHYFSDVSFEDFMAIPSYEQFKALDRLSALCESISASDELREKPDMEHASQFLTHVRKEFG